MWWVGCFGSCTRAGLALFCSVFFFTSTHTAQAGINVWTSNGPPGGVVSVLAIDPLTDSTLYAATYGSGVFKSTPAALMCAVALMAAEARAGMKA